VAEWSKVLGFFRFATSAPRSNLVRPAKSFRRIFRVLECNTLSSRCSIGRLLASLSIWETVKMHSIEFSYTEQLKNHRLRNSQQHIIIIITVRWVLTSGWSNYEIYHFFKFSIFQISRFSDFSSNFQHSNTWQISCRANTCKYRCKIKSVVVEKTTHK
jgi:hypothetical protein